MPARPGSRRNKLKPLPRILSCEAAIPRVRNTVWSEAFEDVVICAGRSAAAKCAEYAQSIGWTNHVVEEIDFAADTVRSKAESPAKLRELFANMNF